MPEWKLPPGPWRVTGDDLDPIEVVDAGGEGVIDGSANGLLADPEILRAVVVLPSRVEAARRLMSWVKVERQSGLELPYSVDMGLAALGDALDLTPQDRGVGVLKRSNELNKEEYSLFFLPPLLD